MAPSSKAVTLKGPPRAALVIATTACAGALLVACGGEQGRQIGPLALAMTSSVHPFYSDQELTLYETQLPVNLPIAKPSAAQEKALGGKVGPFSHHPWVTADDVQIQLTWTLANLDTASHTVAVLVDPWNEFGRYVPAVQIDGDDSTPDLSGIQHYYALPGLGSGRSSRIEQTFSYDDMNELAIDFATAINILTTVKPPAPSGDQTEVDDPRVGLVNYVFDFQNRHDESPLTDKYIPTVIPGLLGFNVGIQTREPANIALEVTIEVVDVNGGKVLDESSKAASLVAPDHVYSLNGL